MLNKMEENKNGETPSHDWLQQHGILGNVVKTTSHDEGGEDREGAEGQTAVCVCVCNSLQVHALFALNLWWLLDSVISVLKLGVKLWSFDIKCLHRKHSSWHNWITLISNPAEGQSWNLKGIRGGSAGERVRGWKGGLMEGGKTKKRDNYYRAGCRGTLFSPSSLCSRKTTIGGFGESQN